MGELQFRQTMYFPKRLTAGEYQVVILILYSLFGCNFALTNMISYITS